VNYRHLALLCDLTGSFGVALGIDILMDVTIDHRLPVQNMLAAQVDGGMIAI